MKFSNNLVKTLAFMLLVVGFEVAYAASAGNVIRATGVVNAVDATGKSRALSSGDAVSVGETVTSADKSTVQIQMMDAAVIAMTGDSVLKIKEYNTEKVDLFLEKGRIRTITGQGDKKGYMLNAAGTQIGVNGTIFDVMINPDGTVAVVLRDGAVSVTSGGVTQTLDVPGTATTVSSAGLAPGDVISFTDLATGDTYYLEVTKDLGLLITPKGEVLDATGAPVTTTINTDPAAEEPAEDLGLPADSSTTTPFSP